MYKPLSFFALIASGAILISGSLHANIDQTMECQSVPLSNNKLQKAQNLSAGTQRRLSQNLIVKGARYEHGNDSNHLVCADAHYQQAFSVLGINIDVTALSSAGLSDLGDTYRVPSDSSSPDLPRANALYQVALQKNGQNVNALFGLGMISLHGIPPSLPADHETAVVYLRQAANLGHGEAAEMIASISGTEENENTVASEPAFQNSQQGFEQFPAIADDEESAPAAEPATQIENAASVVDEATTAQPAPAATAATTWSSTLGNAAKTAGAWLWSGTKIVATHTAHAVEKAAPVVGQAVKVAAQAAVKGTLYVVSKGVPILVKVTVWTLEELGKAAYVMVKETAEFIAAEIKTLEQKS